MITSFELMSTKDFVSAFYSDKNEFMTRGGTDADFENFLRWAEVQKLERINDKLSKILSAKDPR